MYFSIQGIGAILRSMPHALKRGEGRKEYFFKKNLLRQITLIHHDLSDHAFGKSFTQSESPSDIKVGY